MAPNVVDKGRRPRSRSLPTQEPGVIASTAQGTAAIRDPLLTIARSRPRPGDGARIRACLAPETDWTAMVSIALEHGVAGLLCRRLLSDADDLLPADIRDAAARFLDEMSARYAEGVAQLLDLLSDLAAAGVVAAPFKGPALARVAYAEPALRGFRDLDILINEADVPSALSVLRRRGYQSQYPDLIGWHLQAYHRYNGQDVLFAAGLLPVEPHWQLGQSTLAARLDIGAMLRRCVPITLTGQTVSVLSPEDALLAMTFHGAKEEWVSLKGIVDVAELLSAHPALDWEVLLERAKRAGLRRVLLLGLHLASEMLNAPVPRNIRELIATDRALLRLGAVVAGRMFTVPVVERSVFAVSSFRWQMRERMRDRLRYVGATITTPRMQHFRMVNLPHRLAFLYPAVKVMHDYIALPLWLAARKPARRLLSGLSTGRRGDAA